MAEYLFEIVARHGRESATKTAISRRVSGTFAETSYAELTARALCFAGLWQRLPTGRSVVPMLVARSPDSIAFMLGAMAAERPFCFLSPKYRAPQLATVLEATGSPACAIDAVGLAALRGAWGKHPIFARVTWILVDDPPQTKLHLQSLEDLRAIAEVVVADGEPAQPAQPHAPRTDAAGTCLFTSGSTGAPKGVLISEADLMGRVHAEIDWFGLGRDDVLLAVLPFSFDVGLNQMMTALATGAELVLLDSWLPADIAATIAARRVTGVSGVPSIWQDLVSAGARFETDGQHASLRYLTVSGGSLPATLQHKLAAAAPGVGIFKTYGQTEAFRATSLRPEDFRGRGDSVGRPFPGVKLHVIREDLTRCAPGEVGEVVHSGLGVMMSYLDEPAGGSAHKLRANPGFGEGDDSPLAIFTGDLGYLDEQGYLYLKDRRDSMLKIKGNRVYPQEVTNQILAIDAVRDALVVGASDDDGSTILVAFIVAASGADLSLGAVRRELNTSLPSFMIPKEILFVDRLPRTATGKPDRRLLIEEYHLDRPRSAAMGAQPHLESEG